jgi:hypothetical protein
MRTCSALVAACLVLAQGALAAPPALLFRASFDVRGDADFARGSPLASAGCVVAENGGRSRGALLARPGAPCRYALAENLDLREGTLSFWARAHDWRDGEGRSQLLFRIAGRVGGRPLELYVDSPHERGQVRLLVLLGDWRDSHRELFQIYAPVDWQRGWQKIDVTWRAGELALYANGVRGETLRVPGLSLAELSAQHFDVTHPGFFGDLPDRTAIDDFEIWRGAFTEERIARRFVAATSPALPPVRLAVPQRSELPGAEAARFPLLADVENGFAALVAPELSAAWEPAALELRLSAPRTDFAAGMDGFDLELHAASGAVQKIRVVRAGGDRAAADAAIATETDGTIWRARVRVPAAAFGRSALSAGETLGVSIAHVAAEPGGLGRGASLGTPAMPAQFVLGAGPAGLRVVAAPAAELGALALDVARRGGVHASLTTGLASRARADARESHSLRAAAAGDGASTLHFEARAATGALLASFALRAQLPRELGVARTPRTEARALEVALDLAWLSGDWRAALARGAARLELTHTPPSGASERAGLTLSSELASASLSRGLEPGAHALRVLLAGADPQRSLALPIAFRVPALPWFGARLPSDAKRLDPWPAIVAGPDRADVWGRTYRFDGPLLVGAEDANGALLREPMQLRLRAGEREALLRTTRIQRRSASDAQARWSGEAEFAGSAVSVRWSTRVEFDGFVWTRLELTPAARDLQIDRLDLEIPLAPSIARWLRGTREATQIRSGRVPWDGRRFEARFEPFVWLTDDARGFLFIAESDANWAEPERAGAIVVRGGADAGITLRMIRSPVRVNAPLVYEFGFQATPVKPELADARAWNFGVGEAAIPRERAIAWYDGYATWDGLWEPARVGAARAAQRRFAATRGFPFYYATLSAAPAGDAAFRFFEPLWRSAWAFSYALPATPASPLRDARPASRLAAVRPASPSFQARMLHDAARLLREVGARGFYTDTDEVFADGSGELACGYPDAFGRSGVCWGILAKRSFAKRFANLLRSGPERAYWLSHAHAKLVPPVHGFADFWLPGEELTTRIAGKPHYYSDELDLETWAAEYRGAQSGVVHVLLPELWRGTGREADVFERAPSEGLVAMAAVNDVNVSALWANRDVIGDYWRLRERLGLAGAKFVGHWRTDCPVRAQPEGALASLYETARGPVIVLANRAATKRQLSVRTPWARARWRDERTDAVIVSRAGEFHVTLPGRSYTYLARESLESASD